MRYSHVYLTIDFVVLFYLFFFLHSAADQWHVPRRPCGLVWPEDWADGSTIAQCQSNYIIIHHLSSSGYYDRQAGTRASPSAQTTIRPPSARARWPPASLQNLRTPMLIGGTIHPVSQFGITRSYLSSFIHSFSFLVSISEPKERKQDCDLHFNINNGCSFAPGRACKHLCTSQVQSCKTRQN